jgi:hypothetical protein
MADSTLDPVRTPRQPEPKGHGTDALGPSGSSDSGSDLQGPGLRSEAGLGLDTGSTSDLARKAGAGADVGDANLDSDSDEFGTGETASAGRDTSLGDAPDIRPDRIIGGEPPMPTDALDRISLDEPDSETDEHVPGFDETNN